MIHYIAPLYFMCVGEHIIRISRTLYNMYQKAYQNCVETHGTYLLILDEGIDNENNQVE